MINRGENTFVVVLIIFSATAFWQAFNIAGFSKWASPGVFPMLASATMLVAALCILVSNYRQRAQSKKEQPTPTVGIAPGTDSDNVDAPFETSATDSLPTLPARVFLTTVLLFLYVITMPTLGFLLSSGLFLFTSISYLWKKPLWMSFLISVFSLVVIHLIFRLAFQVILPQGTLISMFS